jgi:hypothetical protein
LIGFLRLTSHKCCALNQIEKLIQAPNSSTETKAGWTGTPTQQAMAGGMHPGLVTAAAVITLLVAQAGPQQIADQKLAGTGHRLLSCESAQASPSR